ncbi:MAG: AAA family ATPase [Caldilineaceae bacterium]|nr:AAA family ATPase [Caldilineaceae bacterium]
MITKITLRNFKSHKYTTLNLDDSRLHAIVGQNSSGKTSILQALHYLSQLAHRPFSAIFQSDREAEFLARSGQNQFDVTAQGYWGYRDRQDWTASFTWEKQTNNGWSPSCCWALDSGKECRSGWSRSFQEAPFPIPQAIGQAVYLKLVANNLARAAYSDDVVPRVEYDGSGLAPTLDYLRGEDPEVFEQIVEMLRRVVPGVRGLDVRRAKVEIFRQRTIEVDGKALPYEERREITGQEVTLNMSSGERIPAHAVSEGTMLTLGLLTVLFSPRKPNLILLDDIEQGLHPHAQRALVGLLQQILDENRNLQILFTTHSPYIIDELMPSQVHVLNSTDQGYATTSRLDEHPDAEWASQTLTTGEFWDAEGESWVTGEPSSG